MKLRSWLVPMALLPLAVGACSSDPDGAAAAASSGPVTSIVHDMSTMDVGSMDMGSTVSTDSGPKVVCAQHMPGDLLTASEAMVIFDAEHVCLAYVTVTAGTAITWHNDDAVARRVSVTDGNDTEITAFDVPAGGAVSRSIDVPGIYRYGVSSIESFVGTLEVQKP